MIQIKTPAAKLFAALLGAVALAAACGALSAGVADGAMPARMLAAGKRAAAPASGSLLTVQMRGSGSGTITSDIGAIDCGSTCSDSFGDGTPVTLTATPAAGHQFTGWLGPCTGVGTCQFTVQGATFVSATFASAYIGARLLDIDDSAACEAPTDGLLVLRHLFGIAGPPLIDGALAGNAGRTTDKALGDYLTDITPQLDIDGNGQADALSDGLLIFRYLAGLRGDELIAGVARAGATRVAAPDIEAHIQSLTTIPPAVGIAEFSADRSVLTAGTSATLTPSFVHAGHATIDHGVGPVASGAGYVVSPLVTTTYTLSVEGVGGPLTRTLTLTVVPAPAIISFSATAGGSLSGATTQSVVTGEDATPVSALPAAGYGFVNWTGTGGFVTSTANPLVVAGVQSDMAITAHFALLPVIGSFTPYAATIGKGQPAYLSWTGLSYYTSASIDHGVGPVVAPNGMASAYPVVDTTYTLTATNAAGTVSKSVGIAVVPPPAIISFTATPPIVAAGQATTLSWTVTGATTYTINNGVGVVAGTSVDVIPPVGTTVYGLTASGPYGSRYAQTTVLSGPPAALSYATNPATYQAGVAIAPNTPSNSGGPITAYASTPVLPTGLVLDPASGVISGTPAASASFANYLIKGSNSYGEVQVSLGITVTEKPPAITYPAGSFVFQVGAPVWLIPVNAGGVVATWAIHPSLPAGLDFNTANGQITGSPLALAASQTYTVTATNAGGTSTPSFDISVVQSPPVIAYPGGTHTLVLGAASATLTPLNTGGPASTWSIDPALPSGLVFNVTSGTIGGTPMALSPPLAYTVHATNLGGTGVATVTLAVAAAPPVITMQPHGQILKPGDLPALSVTATGTGTLAYQWYRDGSPIDGAIDALYPAPAFSPADDGAVYTVVVTSDQGGTIASDPARLSLFVDLTAWLTAHPAIAAAIKWQYQPASANVYIPPAEGDKHAWADWTIAQKAELDQAYLDAVAWFTQGAPQVTMTPGTGITDQPVNLHPSVSTDSSPTLELVSPAHLWKLYIAHVAFSLMLETSHQVPWSVTDYTAPMLKWIFDSSTMGWYLPNGNFYMGTYESAGLPAYRTDNRARTTLADPRWTYPWLRQAGIVAGSRLSTIGRTMDWMRANMTHFFGSENFGNDEAIWQYRGYSPLSRIVEGTIDSRYTSYGVRHWTAGCHGSTGFMAAALRVLNIPVQPIWACAHELVYFISEDLYMDHGDDPYNGNVRASETSSLMLLIDSATWRSRFGNDETVNILNNASPACAWIGYTAVNFK